SGSGIETSTGVRGPVSSVRGGTEFGPLGSFDTGPWTVTCQEGAHPMIHIDGERLNASLQELARIGATDGGGVTRLTLSDEDKAARDLLARWMTEAGLDVRIDDLGNMSGIRPGIEDAPPVYMG